MARQRLRMAWVAALLAFVALSAGAHPRVAHAAAPDFSFGSSLGSGAFLLRGETWDPHPPCVDCTYYYDYGGPHTAYNDGYGDCYIDSHALTIVPSNGFNAPVTLSVGGLPAGVSSRMPTTLMIPAPGGYSFQGTFALEASRAAPLGPFTVTLTATSGSLVHTLTYTVTVADQAPLCNGNPSPWPALQYNNYVAELTQNQVRNVDIIVGSPAPAGGTVVTITSSDPSVVSAPASVTIPAGLQGATLQINAHQVSSWTKETLTTSANGNTISTPANVSPPSVAETVTITFAQYDSSTGNLLVRASDPNYGGVAALTVLDASTKQVIGTTNNLGGGLFGAVLPVAPKPGTILVVSSITGASATATVQ